MGFVLIRIVRSIVSTFRSFVLLKTVFTLLNTGLLHGDLEELVLIEIETNPQELRITFQCEIDIEMFPFMFGCLSDIYHCRSVSVLFEYTFNDIRIGFCCGARLPGKGMIIVDDYIVIELGTVIVSYLLYQVSEFGWGFDIERFDDFHRIPVQLCHYRCRD